MDCLTRSGSRWFKSGYELLSGLPSSKGMASLSDQAVVSATNFITGIIIARACSKEEFGLFLLGNTLVFLIISIQESLISIPYTVYSPRLSGDELDQYTGSTLVHQIALSALDIVCLLAVGMVLFYNIGPGGLYTVLLALSAAISFILLREYLRRVFFAGLNIKRAFLMDLAVGVVQIGALFVFAYFKILSLFIVFCVIGLACCLVSLPWLAWFRGSFIFVRSRFAEDFKRNWSFGKWHLSSTTVYWAGSKTFPWFLAAFYGTKATGTFAACLGISALANPILMGMINYLRPRMAQTLNKDGIDKMLHILLKSVIVISIMMVIFNIGAFLIGEHLVALAYGDKYTDTGIIVSVLILSLSIDALVVPVNCALYAMDRPDVGFKSRLIALVVALVPGLWLVSSFGVIGAAVGLVAVNLAAAAYEAVTFIKAAGDFRIIKQE